MTTVTYALNEARVDLSLLRWLQQLLDVIALLQLKPLPVGIVVTIHFGSQ